MRAVVRLVVCLGLVVGGVSLGPLAAADPATADPTPTGTASATTTPAPEPSESPRSKAAASEPTPVTTIDSDLSAYQLDTTPTFTYHADSVDPRLRFRCELSLGGVAQPPRPCSGAAGGDGTTRGSLTYTALEPSAQPYELTVTAYLTAVAPATDETLGTPDVTDWHLYSITSPDTYSPSTGASFNNPLGKKGGRRTNLRRVIRTINSMPGYAEPAADQSAPCPKDASAMVPSTIKITLYSMTDGRFAKAMVAAARRCVRTQILMDSHLSAENDVAWRTLQDALRTNRNARVFARRCRGGCRGRLLHTKMYLFDSSVPAPLSSKDRNDDTVMVGSSNMTANASRVQWNDLYTAHGRKMFKDYSSYFDLMKRDDGFHRNAHDFVSGNGRYRTTFWPVAAHRTEPYLAALRSIRCGGATGGTGINGHSVVYLNMHAWFGTRGLAIMRQVRKLYAQGCYIRVLYSFMTKAVYHGLRSGTGSRMITRRTVFSLDGDRYADVYSHFKNITASGNIAGDSSNRVVWTGSNNFTSDGDHFDEVMLRIQSASAYRAYRDRFTFISRRKSSSVYATFLEPRGGGRAPTPKAVAAASSPALLSGAVVQNPDGSLRALD